MSSHRRVPVIAMMLILALALVAACGARAPEQVATEPSSAGAPFAGVAPAAPPPGPGEADEARGAADDELPTPLPDVDASGTPVPPGQRKLVKNGEMRLVVEDLLQAIGRASSTALELGGYVLSTESSAEGATKTATVKVGVPSERFETAMEQLRGLALDVRWERSSGTDVTAEYVDLESQLTNLRATLARLRQFLEEAATVEEALLVNTELTRIEGEIETIVGRMNYLRDRTAYSTITLYLEQDAPPPTITPTPTPIVWRPAETFDRAQISLQYVMRGLGDFAIWAAVVCLPLLFIAMLLLIPLAALRRRLRRKPKPPAPPANGAA